MNTLTDQQLLRAYTGSRSESAFAELVRRHVDFVYSAALRMVRDAHLAEDVTQGVFVALARNARQLADHPVLAGWLHRTAQNLAANTVRSDVRRRIREQKAAAMNELISAEPDTVWEQIAPHLDAAVGELSELDHAALLLRYFQHKSAREIGQTLGISEDAAQKRVSRAVDRLRESFSKRGVTVGASGLVVVISANAVQAAPAGLAVTISTAAALAGTAVQSSAAIAATKAIAMTTLQKTLITATIVAAVGTGIYEARQASALRSQVQTLQQQEAGQIRQWQQERNAATRQLAALRDENVRLNNNTAELQGTVARLSQSQQESAPGRANATTNNYLADALDRMMNDPEFRNDFREIQVKVAKARYASLFKELTLTPEEQETLIRLRVDQVILNQDKYTALMKGGDVTELQKEVDAGREKFDGERKALLGDDGFKQLKDYENTWFVRMTVDAFKGALEDSNPLSGDQAQQLLEIMIQERAKNPPLENRDDAELVTLKRFDAEAAQQLLQAQEQVNQQVLSRARGVFKS